jgi:tetratricopeptide (TPR) repeat protein
MKLWVIVLLLSTTVWARPEGVITGHPWAAQAQTAIDDGRFDEALVLLQVDLLTPLDHAWHAYLTGCAQIGNDEPETAAGELQRAKAGLAELSDDPFANRLLSRVERKLGLIERKRGNYDESRKIHFAALDLAQRFGSAEEEHDCLISIDVDCWHLKDWTESERVLRQSLEVAAQINEPIARTRAQATSNNNLAGTLSELKNFEEAQEKANAALAAWTEWESMTGDKKDFRSGWAHYTLADVYLQWAANLENKLEASNKRGMAKYELILMQALAQEAKRPQADFDEISRRLPECE